MNPNLKIGPRLPLASIGSVVGGYTGFIKSGLKRSHRYDILVKLKLRGSVFIECQASIVER